jgi:hypothetical protein
MTTIKPSRKNGFASVRPFRKPSNSREIVLPSSFFSDIEPVQNPLESYASHGQIAAQDAFGDLTIVVQRLGDYLLGEVLFNSDQRTDSVDLSSLAPHPGPGQLSEFRTPRSTSRPSGA